MTNRESVTIRPKKRNDLFLFSVINTFVPENRKHPMNRSLTPRHLVAPLLTLSLLGAGAVVATGTAVAAEPAPRPDAAVSTPADSPEAAPAIESVTANTTVTAVRAWQEFRISGKTKGVKPGYTVLVQQKQGKNWRALPATTTVQRDGSYSLRVKLGLKGKNELRTVTGAKGTAVSKTIHLTVR